MIAVMIKHAAKVKRQTGITLERNCFTVAQWGQTLHAFALVALLFVVFCLSTRFSVHGQTRPAATRQTATAKPTPRITPEPAPKPSEPIRVYGPSQGEVQVVGQGGNAATSGTSDARKSNSVSGQTGQTANAKAVETAPGKVTRATGAALPVMTLGGKVLDLSDVIMAGKPTLVNFWATWCGVCRRELEFLKLLKNRFPAEQLQIVLLNVENPYTEAAAVRNFLQQNGLNLPVYFGDSRLCEMLNNGAPCNSIPQNFLFGRDRRLLDSFAGFSEVRLANSVRFALAGNGR